MTTRRQFLTAAFAAPVVASVQSSWWVMGKREAVALMKVAITPVNDDFARWYSAQYLTFIKNLHVEVTKDGRLVLSSDYRR